MKRSAKIAMTAAAALLTAGGCGGQRMIDALVRPDAAPGQVWLGMSGRGEHRLTQRGIDLHRRIHVGDGVRIDTWVMHARSLGEVGRVQPAHGTIVLLHALHESKASLHHIGQRLSFEGWDVVLPDLRSHGRSGGRYVTLGDLESRDVHIVVRTLREDRVIDASGPIYAVGAGLGASTAIQYALLEPACQGVLAIAPYRDYPSFAQEALLAMEPGMDTSRRRRIEHEAARQAGFDVRRADTLQAASRLTVPIIVAHGLLDLSVPRESAQAVYDASPQPKHLEIIDPTAERPDDCAWVAQQVQRLAGGL